MDKRPGGRGRAYSMVAIRSDDRQTGSNRENRTRESLQSSALSGCNTPGEGPSNISGIAKHLPFLTIELPTRPSSWQRVTNNVRTAWGHLSRSLRTPRVFRVRLGTATERSWVHRRVLISFEKFYFFLTSQPLTRRGMLDKSDWILHGFEHRPHRSGQLCSGPLSKVLFAIWKTFSSIYPPD